MICDNISGVCLKIVGYTPKMDQFMAILIHQEHENKDSLTTGFSA